MVAALAMGCIASAEAGTDKEVKLPAPDRTRGISVMEAFAARKSVRECATKEITLQDLSDVLWAANGVNRPAEGRRTAPSALNVQDIDIYAFTAEGVYLYRPKEHALTLVREGDHRNVLAGPPSPARTQDYVARFPLILLYVSELSRFGMEGEQVKQMAAMDAGIVSENVNIFCAGTGLCTVTRASMDREGVIALLGLTDRQLPLLNNPVGYPGE